MSAVAKRNRRERAAAHAREDILDAAASVFAKKGYAAAGVQEIAAEAGFGAASLYSYFKGKRAIWDALLDVVTHGILELFERPLPAGLSLEQRLEFILLEQLSWIDQHRTQIVAVMTPPPAEVGDDEKDPPPDFTALSTGYFASACAEYPDHPALADMAPEEAGYVLWGLVQGYFARWIAQGDTSQPLSAQAGKIVRVFCHGAIGARAVEAGVAST
ncbi:MAG: TetR/AcrR family transcriptional regulator [Sandaracinaceae bacterium]|nr:TetR/AcrR family transcriptional regulator [Sandaracinaceae bacterium]